MPTKARIYYIKELLNVYWFVLFVERKKI